MINESRDKHKEIDVREIFKIFYEKRIFIFFLVLLSSLVSFIYTLFLPDIYLSETILAPSDSVQESSNFGDLSLLASIGGFSLPGGNGDKVDRALEIIESLSFFEEIAKKNEVLLHLIAANGWNKKTKQLDFNESIYDSKNKKFLLNSIFMVEGKISTQKAQKVFLKGLSVSKDRDTSFIRISFSHYSPDFAKQMVDLIVGEVNLLLRLKAVSESERSIKFLEQEIEKTNFVEIKKSLNSIISEQLKIKMTANSQEEYVFSVLSPAYVPEQKNTPQRALIVLLSSFLALIIGSLISIYRHFY